MLDEIIISPIITQDMIREPKAKIDKVENLPVTFKIDYPFEPKFQGPNLSCYGCLMAEWYEIIYNGDYRRELNKYLFDTYELSENDILEEDRKFSIGFPYGNRSDDDYLGAGAIIRQQLVHCKNEGIVLSREYDSKLDMPEIKEELDTIKDKLFEKASFFKIKDFYRLKNLDEVKLFMYNYNIPVIASMNLYSNFNDIGKDGIVPPASGVFLSKHGVLLTGWNEFNQIIALNSYGKNWGDNGYCYFDPNEDRIFSEFWAVIPQDHIIFPEDIAKIWRIHIYSSHDREDASRVANEFRNKQLTEYQKFILNTKQNFLDAILIKKDDNYRVQVGAFNNKENAFKMIEVLQDMEYNDIIVNTRNPIQEIIEE